MRALFSFIYACTLFSCGTGRIAPTELDAYVVDEENGLRKTIILGERTVEVINRPTDLWVYQVIGDQPTQAGKIDSLRKKYGAAYYFILRLSKGEKELLHQSDGFDRYSQLLQTLSFRMPEYVFLSTSANDTIPVGDFILNRTFGLNNATEVLFVFDKVKAKHKEWVQFNLREFGLGVGNQQFQFRVEDLEKLPEVAFEASVL